MSGKRYPMHPSVAQKVIVREAGSCAVCGLGMTNLGHIHHRRPRGSGGGRYANSVSNLLHLHHSCHLYEVERNRQKAYSKGWLVKASLEPSTVPVWYGLRKWVILDDEGNLTEIEEEIANELLQGNRS